MNRRDFLKGLSEETLTPCLAVIPTAGSPRQYRTGTRILIEDAHAWLCRDATGFYAIDAHCPHLGCLIRPQNEEGWVCPCHGSRFSASGERLAGSAPRNLRFLYIDLDDTGNLRVRRDRTADPNDRLMA
jgi:cytochrome b6-f complex iron-sulfur subunit